jgi:hypothetical protein
VETNAVITLVNIGIALLCLGVLGITVKLYTEILKDRKFDSRAEKHGHGGVKTAPAQQWRPGS